MSSTRAKHWAWCQLDLTRSELLLLLAMADNVGEDLRCYAKVQTLAAMARLSERQAQRLLDKLVADGRAERTVRPGLTTLYRLQIPADFGAETGDRPRRRKGRSTPDTMSGVHGSSPAGATPDNVSGVTPDTMSGVQPPTPCRDTPTPCRGTDDTMSPDSSLNSSLPNPLSAPARDGSNAVALTREEQRELRTLDYEAARLKVSKRTANETFEHYRKRISDEVTAELAHRQRKLREDHQPDEATA